MKNMKKTKLFSLLISLLMLLSMIPLSMLSVSATTAIPTQPTTLPGNMGVAATLPLVDFSKATNKTIGLRAADQAAYYTVTDDNMMKIGAREAEAMGSFGNLAFYSLTNSHTAQVNNFNEPLYGASGVMFYVDMSEAEAGKDLAFALGVQVAQNNSKDANLGNVAFVSALPTALLERVETRESTAYFYNADGEWEAITSNESYITNTANGGTAGTGWYYIGFDQLYCVGGSTNYSAAKTAGDDILDMPMDEFVARCVTRDVNNVGFYSNTVGAKFGEIQWVYPQYANASEYAAEAPVFQNAGAHVYNGNTTDMSYTDVNGDKALKFKLTGNSATSASNGVYLLDDLDRIDLSSASGFKFYVDTTALGDNAALQIRMRFQLSEGPNVIGDWIFSKTRTANDSNDPYYDTDGYYNPDSETTSLMQFAVSSHEAIAYYEDADGTKGTLKLDTASNPASGGDLFEALPVGFEGYVYIPLEYFALGAINGNTQLPRVPYTEVARYNNGQFCYATRLHVQHAVTGTAASDEVTYSNLSLVYDDLSLTTSSVTLENDLSLNVGASATDAVSNVNASFVMNGVAKTSSIKQIANGYTFTCENILPQDIGKTVKLTVSGTVTGKRNNPVTATTELETSVKEYCLKLLGSDGATEAEKKIAADLLRYGAAAQSFAEETVSDPIIDTDTAALINGIGSTVGTVTGIPENEMLTASTNTAYGFESAAFRLEGKLAVKLKFKAESTDTLTVTVSVNGREAITYGEDDFATDTDGNYYIVCNDIGADDMDAPITAKLMLGTDELQTLNYSVATYVANVTGASDKETALINALYAYGTSAKLYAAQ